MKVQPKFVKIDIYIYISWIIYDYCELYEQAKKYTILWPCGKIGNPPTPNILRCLLISMAIVWYSANLVALNQPGYLKILPSS